jgi:hypothetical protein
MAHGDGDMSNDSTGRLPVADACCHRRAASAVAAFQQARLGRVSVSVSAVVSRRDRGGRNLALLGPGAAGILALDRA